MQAAIETDRLCRSFAGKRAVDAIDLLVPHRSVTGFLGPNGAGKTTTIRMLLGLLRPSSGSVRIFGKSLAGERLAIARDVGALVETPCHYDHLTGRENLEVTRRLLRLDGSEADRVLALTGLRSAAQRRVGGYSLGMRQRLGIARALLGRPRLLILDEPTNGLDPEGIIEVRKLLRALPREEDVTVLVSSHLLREVELMVDHVALVWNGRLVAQAPLVELLGRMAARTLIEVGDPARALQLLESNGVEVRTVRHEAPSLESAYLSLTSEAA